MIVHSGLHRIQTLSCTPAEARPILRAFLADHPKDLYRIEMTFRALTLKLIRRSDLDCTDLSGWISLTQAMSARLVKDDPMLAGKLDLLAALLFDRWLICQREPSLRAGRRKRPGPNPLTEGGPAQPVTSAARE